MYLVLCYDVVDNGRRAKLAKRLEGFLDRVQKSVFEGSLPSQRHPELIRLIETGIDHETDTVRIYHLCRGCRGVLELYGTSRVVEEASDVIL